MLPISGDYFSVEAQGKIHVFSHYSSHLLGLFYFNNKDQTIAVSNKSKRLHLSFGTKIGTKFLRS